MRLLDEQGGAQEGGCDIYMFQNRAHLVFIPCAGTERYLLSSVSKFFWASSRSNRSLRWAGISALPALLAISSRSSGGSGKDNQIKREED